MGGVSGGRRRGAGRVALRRLSTREGAGDLGRGLPAEPGMRTGVVVVGAPPTEQHARLGERGEQRLVQELVAQAPVERLDERILDRLSRRDIVPFHPGLVCPAQDRGAGELRSVVADDHPWLAARRDQPIEFGCDPQTRERRVGNQGDVLAGAVVDDRQDAEAAAIGELIRHEVEAPALVRPQGQQPAPVCRGRAFARRASPRDRAGTASCD